MKKKVKQYIEVEQLSMSLILFPLIAYPILLLIGLFMFIINFIRYNLKLLYLLIISFIPVLNIFIINVKNNEINWFDDFDKLFENFDNLKEVKKYEVKEEK